MQSPVEYALIYGTPVPGYIAPAAVLSGGLAVVPDYSLSDVDAGTAPEPDVVVVPAVVFPAGRKERPLREWLARRAGRGALLAFSCRRLGGIAGAVSMLPASVSRDPPAAPGVRLSSHRALHASCPVVSRLARPTVPGSTGSGCCRRDSGNGSP